jgi:hypothetical protein
MSHPVFFFVIITRMMYGEEFKLKCPRYVVSIPILYVLLRENKFSHSDIMVSVVGFAELPDYVRRLCGIHYFSFHVDLLAPRSAYKLKIYSSLVGALASLHVCRLSHTSATARSANSLIFLRSLLLLRDVHRVLVGKSEGTRPLGRPRRRWEDNIKMDLQEVGGDCGDWMEWAQDRDRWRALVSTVMNFRVP